MSTRAVTIQSPAEQSPQVPPQKTKKKPEIGRKKTPGLKMAVAETWQQGSFKT